MPFALNFSIKVIPALATHCVFWALEQDRDSTCSSSVQSHHTEFSAYYVHTYGIEAEFPPASFSRGIHLNHPNLLIHHFPQSFQIICSASPTLHLQQPTETLK